MYKKYAAFLLMMNLIFLLCAICVKGIEANQILSTEAFKLSLTQSTLEEKSGFFGTSHKAASGQRIVDVDIISKPMVIAMTEEDYQVLCRIVEAEAGCEDDMGKLLVANVVINRVKSEHFPNSVSEVVFQQENGVSQFSPVNDGRYQSVEISQQTRDAVENALLGQDVSQGALYFAARNYADPSRMAWFDDNLHKLFTYGGHEFFL